MLSLIMFNSYYHWQTILRMNIINRPSCVMSLFIVLIVNDLKDIDDNFEFATACVTLV